MLISPIIRFQINRLSMGNAICHLSSINSIPKHHFIRTLLLSTTLLLPPLACGMVSCWLLAISSKPVDNIGWKVWINALTISIAFAWDFVTCCCILFILFPSLNSCFVWRNGTQLYESIRVESITYSTDWNASNASVLLPPNTFVTSIDN